ncbi:MAG: FAD-binding protein, partial [Jiangellaceae bacterium]
MSRQLSSTSTNSGTWRNWARTVEARPARVEIPADQDHVAAVLAAAAREGRTVRPVGSGHSFTPVAATDGVQVRLDNFRGVRSLVGDSET